MTPSKTFTSVIPPANDAMLPSESAGKLWFSFVKKTVTASVPSTPSDPSAPPSTLNTFILSSNESLVTSIVIGRSDFETTLPAAGLAPLSNVILPLSNPEPSETTPPKLGVVIVPPPAFVIVILPVLTVPLRFC